LIEYFCHSQVRNYDEKLGKGHRLKIENIADNIISIVDILPVSSKIRYNTVCLLPSSPWWWWWWWWWMFLKKWYWLLTHLYSSCLCF